MSSMWLVKAGKKCSTLLNLLLAGFIHGEASLDDVICAQLRFHGNANVGSDQRLRKSVPEGCGKRAAC
ncbi:hypothetical protein JMJ77_0007001 [Colletotrichum scovillei]|uniref:Secreted protein n=1 Tax=Colletotrichum scovillei TaxID=1209932 RepID=A0A9P7UG33_9PEZI|nr:hypothetical protein JMJ77_0007001 [Colletotrichum scovillei]KAG7073965.1 hypothetical protein JMJ76_0010456 [Colletotrichum scovillei]KAG7081107.1 hypothetical protein JMJ78_0003236 [Colletotrichum scovillei]